MNNQPILAGADLVKKFRVASRGKTATLLTALDGVSLLVGAGETLGIAGESGCGKSTLARVMAGLMKPEQGSVCYRGVQLSALSAAEHARFRRSTQMIFQDPFSSLNPRMRIGDSIAEPLKIAGIPAARQREEVARIMNTVGLDAGLINRFPDEFSGGQRQRIGIARALAAKPEILIADEPVSSLDISIQAQIINLLMQMKSDFNLSMMIISHNLMVLRHVCDRIIVMYLGSVVEIAPAAALFNRCMHPYTEALIAAIPGFTDASNDKKTLLKDDLPSPTSIPSGCRFHPRCRYAVEICRQESPPLTEYAAGHEAACHLSRQLFG
ncbi:MAG: ATP-binding cassette domain-containing protein [Deltaproteobacteria bacterium]|nr:ATP-binding cassette domain-containing protein [Deltaproteobacteria bacterium]